MRTIKAVLGLGLGVLLGLSITSCAPPPGCNFKTISSFDFGSRTTYTERVDIFGNLIIEERTRPLSRTFTVCSFEEELELDRLYNSVDENEELIKIVE